MAKKSKEGRRRMSRLDMSTEGGRLMLHDLINFKKSGFSPFIKSSHQSEAFWKSRKEYQEVPLPAFLEQAEKLAEIAIAQMPSKERREEEARIELHNKPSQSHEEPPHNPCSSDALQKNNKRLQSLRNTIVAPYPNGDMAIVIFELDGDVDESAVELQFERKGAKIYVHGRVPRELTNAASLLGSAESRNSIQDADCMLLDQVIRQRLQGSKQDNEGNVWELREIIDLPFECKTTFFNKYGQEISTYLLRKNDEGYAWGYFWVVGKHVGKKDDCPKKIRCIATSDEECDGESDRIEDSSHLTRSDDDLDEMSIQYEVETNDKVNGPIEELKKDLEIQRLAHLQVKRDFESEINDLKQRLEEKSNIEAQLQASLVSKDGELVNLKNMMESEVMRLREQGRDQHASLEDEKKKSGELANLKNTMESEVMRLRAQCHDQQEDEKRKTSELANLKNLMESEVMRLRALCRDQQASLEDEKKKTGELLNSKNMMESEVMRLQAKSRDQEASLQDEKKKTRAQQQENEKLRGTMQELEEGLQKINELNQNEMQNRILSLTEEERLRERVQELERKIDCHEKNHHVKDLRIKELEELCNKNGEQISILETQTRTQIKEYGGIIDANNKKIDELEIHLQEERHQCVYQTGQAEKLSVRVVELEKLCREKDEQNQLLLKQIDGLKHHVEYQMKYIKELKRGEGKTRKCRTSLEEKQENEFIDFDRWDTDESVSDGSPNNNDVDEPPSTNETTCQETNRELKEPTDLHGSIPDSNIDRPSLEHEKTYQEANKELQEPLDFNCLIPGSSNHGIINEPEGQQETENAMSDDDQSANGDDSYASWNCSFATQDDVNASYDDVSDSEKQATAEEINNTNEETQEEKQVLAPCEANNDELQNKENTSDDQQLPSVVIAHNAMVKKCNQSMKRKSVVHDLKLGSIKKQRKSLRLEERRLAKKFD